MMYRKVTHSATTFLLVLLFTYASLSKLIQHTNFSFQLQQSPYLEQYAGLIVWLLPLAELFVVLLLARERTRQAGLYLSFGFMLAFTAYIYAILHYSDFIPCSCGGILSQMSWEQHFVFNLVFIALSLLGIFTNYNKP
jgi:hypothetical protein